MSTPLTVEQIRGFLDTDTLEATVDGVRYLVTWDEDCSGIYAWSLPIASHDTPAACKFGDDAEEAAPAVHAWMGGAAVLFTEGVWPHQDAVFSPDRMYRYVLSRRWAEGPRALIVIGLNPSTADEREDDPTIRRCIGFAKREGCSGLIMLNLFALRATDPMVMRAHPEPVGELNDQWIRDLATREAHVVVAAWGVHGEHRGRGAEVAAKIPNLLCFGRTKGGHPRHPLYLRADTALEPFNVR
jgi:hypothetical protein